MSAEGLRPPAGDGAAAPAGASAPRRWRIGLLMYDDVELLDHAGPYEVFTTAERMAARLAGPGVPAARRHGFETLSLARDARPVRARAGQRLLPDVTLAEAPPLDLLLVPGGDVSGALADGVLLEWLAGRAPATPWLASVCTGVFLLARAGVLAPGTPVTTHWEDLDELRREAPALEVQAGRRWLRHERAGPVPDGAAPWPFYSSAGISAGLDLSLHLVEQLAGRALAERTARQLDYRWVEA